MKILRFAIILPAALTALAACDPAEFDADPDVRLEARGARTCVTAVRNQTGEAAALNTVLPVVEANQFIVDVASKNQRWVCTTDDAGTAKQLYQLGQG